MALLPPDVIKNMQATLGTAVALGGLSLFFLRQHDHSNGGSFNNLPPLPEVPGLPVVGNLLQLKEKKPHKTFTKWAETYGPIYSIKTGSTSMVVLNSNHVAKEAMVTRFPSISTRKLSNALKILTLDKTMVAMSDYDEFHKMIKRHLLTNVLGPNAQALGKDVESIHVEDLGTTLSREEIFEVLVIDPMEGAIEVDWRDFFPNLKWIPNISFEKKLKRMYTRREAVMKALFQEQRKHIASGEEMNCYIDYLLSEAKTLTDKQMSMLLWETIIETSDTTLVTTEWAMYELAKDSKRQERLYHEIQSVFGSDKISEEKICQLPYLSAVFHETLRKYSPAPIIPLRYVHEDTELGGFHIPAGSEIAINIYGCNMDQKVWANPEEWRPERFLDEGNDSVELHKTMAFGGGKRVCAGALQAMLIACVSIGRLVQEFEWRIKDGEEENVDTLGLTTRKLQPMKAFIKPRN
ncbi:hypothetical protein LguiB_020022 [Lonicera macranthoides]